MIQTVRLNRPLHLACYNGHLDTVKYLTKECQCDPMHRNKKRSTPLDYASRFTHTSVVEYLLSTGKAYPVRTCDIEYLPVLIILN